MKRPSATFIVAILVIVLSAAVLWNSVLAEPTYYDRFRTTEAGPGTFGYSPVIVYGDVLRTERVGNTLDEVTTIEVRELLKGDVPDTDAIRVRERSTVAGRAQFSPRDEVLLFLRPDGHLFRVVGGELGVFESSRDPSGFKRLLNHLRSGG